MYNLQNIICYRALQRILERICSETTYNLSDNRGALLKYTRASSEPSIAF